MNPNVISVVLPALAAADVYDQSLLDPEDGGLLLGGTLSPALTVVDSCKAS